MNGDEVCTCGNVADEHADKGNGELESDPSLCASFDLDEDDEDNITNGYVEEDEGNENPYDE